MAFLARCPDCGHFQVCVFDLESHIKLKCQSCRADFSPAYEDSPAAQEVNWSLAMTMYGHEYEPPRRSSDNLVVIADLPSVYPKRHYPKIRRRKRRRVHVELPPDVPRPTPEALAAEVLLQPTEEAKQDPTAPQAEQPAIVEWSEEMSRASSPPPSPPAVKPRPARKPKVDEDIEYGRFQLNGIAILALFLLVAGLLASSLTSWGIVSLALVGASVLVGAFAVRSSLREGRRLLIPALTLGVGGVVLVISLTTPGVFGPGAFRNSGPPPGEWQIVPHPQFVSDQQIRQAEWIDASKASASQAGTRVEIAEVRIGTVNGGPATVGFLIHLRFYRTSDVPGTPSASLGNTLVWNEKFSATLRHKNGQRFAQDAAISESAQVGGAGTPGRLGLDVRHIVLVFPVSAGSADVLHLELPAEAWGGMGTLKFAIPSSMTRK